MIKNLGDKIEKEMRNYCNGKKLHRFLLSFELCLKKSIKFEKKNVYVVFSKKNE